MLRKIIIAIGLMNVAYIGYHMRRKNSLSVEEITKERELETWSDYFFISKSSRIDLSLEEFGQNHDENFGDDQENLDWHKWIGFVSSALILVGNFIVTYVAANVYNRLLPRQDNIPCTDECFLADEDESISEQSTPKIVETEDLDKKLEAAMEEIKRLDMLNAKLRKKNDTLNKTLHRLNLVLNKYNFLKKLQLPLQGKIKKHISIREEYQRLLQTRISKLESILSDIRHLNNVPLCSVDKAREEMELDELNFVLASARYIETMLKETKSSKLRSKVSDRNAYQQNSTEVALSNDGHPCKDSSAASTTVSCANDPSAGICEMDLFRLNEANNEEHMIELMASGSIEIKNMEFESGILNHPITTLKQLKFSSTPSQSGKMVGRTRDHRPLPASCQNLSVESKDLYGQHVETANGNLTEEEGALTVHNVLFSSLPNNSGYVLEELVVRQVRANEHPGSQSTDSLNSTTSTIQSNKDSNCVFKKK